MMKRNSAGWLLACLLSTASFAQEVPPDAPLDRLIGEVAQSMMRVRNLAVERQSKILELRDRLERCGKCAERDDIESELKVRVSQENTVNDIIDDVAFKYNGSQVEALAKVLNDPLGLQEQEAARQRRARERRDMLDALRIGHCYAITKTQDEQNDCLENFPRDLFLESEQAIYAECIAARDLNTCLTEKSLVPLLRREIAKACSMPVEQADGTFADIAAHCSHPTRPRPLKTSTRRWTISTRLRVALIRGCREVSVPTFRLA